MTLFSEWRQLALFCFYTIYMFSSSLGLTTMSAGTHENVTLIISSMRSSLPEDSTARYVNTHPPYTGDTVNTTSNHTYKGSPAAFGYLDNNILYISIGSTVGVCIIVIIMIICCCRKRGKRKNKSSTRSHQPLCNQDSGAISVPVQRLAGPPVARNLSRESNTGSTRGSVHNMHNPHGTPRSRSDSPGRNSNSVQRDASIRDTTRGGSIYRNSPQVDRLYRDSARNSGRFQDSMGSRDSTRRLGDSFRSSALESAMCRFGRRFDEDQHKQTTSSSKQRDSPKSRDSSLGDGFTLSSSFEGGLDKIDLEAVSRTQASKLSSYDNLNTTSGESDSNVDDFERKQSLYDNIEDDDDLPLVAGTKVKQLEETYAQNLLRRPSPSPQRRTSYTLPLRFTRFNGGQHSSRIYDDDDDGQDYVNVPPLNKNQSKDNGDNPSAAPEKVKRFRRGSQTLKLNCSRRPPIMSKIEKQVLAFVPIYGEPTPEPKTKSQLEPSSPLNDFTFPPPPCEEPPVEGPGATKNVEMRTCFNPMYCPDTATPGCELDSANPFNKPNAYFSY